mmetsp:Transcript_32621/g.87584  ORF Transcript_32621/g.87584 Transcript_32621/m.87584 type:complete len:203 (-) Transcript_32621:207-815(-)
MQVTHNPAKATPLARHSTANTLEQSQVPRLRLSPFWPSDTDRAHCGTLHTPCGERSPGRFKPCRVQEPTSGVRLMVLAGGAPPRWLRIRTTVPARVFFLGLRPLGRPRSSEQRCKFIGRCRNQMFKSRDSRSPLQASCEETTPCNSAPWNATCKPGAGYARKASFSEREDPRSGSSGWGSPSALLASVGLVSTTRGAPRPVR